MNHQERAALGELYLRIDRRCAAIADGRDWPCRQGCDTCCRRLAQPPMLTRVEWERMRESLSRLPAPQLAQIDARMAELAGAAVEPLPSRHFTCPMLNGQTGACGVYDGRPAACRTYGFYVDREHGLWCEQILARSPGLADVVWGNNESVEAELLRLSGGPRSLIDWWGMEPFGCERG